PRSRGRVGSEGSRRELVAGAANRPDEVGTVELAAQLPDVHVDRPGTAGEGQAPDALEDPLPPDYDARRLRELPHEVELARRKLDLRPRDKCGALAAVEDDVAGGEHVLVRLGLGPAEHRVHAGDELTRRERLRDVVVGSQLEGPSAAVS